MLRDFTSPITLLLSLDPSVLDRGLGPVGNIPIPKFLWDLLAPLDFQEVTSRDLGEMPEISQEGLIMARALVRDGILRQCADNLRLLADRGLSLLAYHINLTNAFWSLTLPEPYKNSFRVRIDGRSYAFSCLPFGWCLTSGSSRRTLPRTTMRFHGMENKIPNHCGTWSQASRGTGWTCGRWRR